MLSPIAKFRALLDALMGKKGQINQDVGLGRRILLLLQGKMAARQGVLQTMVDGGQSVRAEKMVKDALKHQAQEVSLTRALSGTLSGTHKDGNGVEKGILREKEAEKNQFFEEGGKPKDIDAIRQKDRLLAQAELSEILKQKGEEHELGVPNFPLRGQGVTHVGKREGLFGISEEGEESGGGGGGFGLGLPSWFKTPPLERKKYIWNWVIRAIILLAAIILALAILL